MRNLLLAAGLMLAGCAALPAPTPVEVPLERQADGRLIVQATIGGFGPYPFIVDTGSSATVLDTQLVEELGLSVRVTGVTVHGVAGAATATAFESVPVGLGGEAITPPWIVGFNLPEVTDARGVIGVDVLSQRTVEIEGDAAVMRLGRTRYAPPEGSSVSRSALVIDAHGLPHVEVRVNSSRGLALVDTGLAGMIIDPAFARRARVPLSDESLRLVDAVNEETAVRRTGRAQLHIGRARWTVGRIALLRPAVLDQLDAGEPTEAILGASVFANSTVVIDFERGHFYIVETPA